MIKIALSMLTVFLVALTTNAQLYQGPAQGTTAAGNVKSTSTFTNAPSIVTPEPDKVRNMLRYDETFEMFIPSAALPSETEIYTEDLATKGEMAKDSTSIFLAQEFEGVTQTNSIPPDPHLAVGPNHLVAVVNTDFAIYDKKGNLLRRIAASSWFTGLNVAALGPFDPKVIYDHYAKRWVMVWLNQDDASKTSYFLISVSDDDDPNGTWFNWALPSNRNGATVVDSWTDYQGVGFDTSAIYISGQNFQFSGVFQFSKLTIVPKSALYNVATPTPITWTDLWDFRYPTSTSQKIFNLRPTISFGEPSPTFNLMHAVNGTSNFYVLAKVTNPLNNPTVSLQNVSVTQFQQSPNGNQLGGSAIAIEGGGSNFRNEPVYKDGFIYAVHAVRNPNNSTYSAVRYSKINPVTGTAVEQSTFGAVGYWHYWPAVMVDSSGNVALTYSRSGTTEYIGAYFTGKLKNETAFRQSYVLETGKSNYVKDFSSGRNRWGDYMGIALDPVNQHSIWMMTEYATNPANTWANRIGEVRMVPFAGVMSSVDADSFAFGNVEVGSKTDTVSYTVSSFGTTPVQISGWTSANSQIKVVEPASFPVTLNAYESIKIRVTIDPATPGAIRDSLKLTSNDPKLKSILITGRAFQINQASTGKLYAAAGSNGSGNVHNVTLPAGSSTQLGYSNYSSGLFGLSVHPKTKMMYGLTPTGSNVTLVRVNALEGDSYPVFEIPVTNVSTAAFDTSGTMYIGNRTGLVYKVNIDAKTVEFIDTAKAAISALTFDPVTNQAYAGLYRFSGATQDMIFKLDIATGDTVRIGENGTDKRINDLFFEGGKLHAIHGAAADDGSIYSIDLTSGLGTLVANTTIRNLMSVESGSVGVVSVEEGSSVAPSTYSVSQNYPNPFNPETVIEFSMPVSGAVRVVVYNMLGEVVSEVANSNFAAGSHKLTWNASSTGSSSGVYFYQVEARGDNGTEFREMKKMILMK